MSDKTTIEINDQTIEVETIVAKDFKAIGYMLKAKESIDPITVALTLYLMCKDICGNLNIEIDDLEEGLVDSSNAH